MSSKRFITASVNYVELFKRCPKNQLENLRSVQAKNKSYIERVESLPAEKKDINWEYYRANVRPEFLPMVEEFEKKYTEFEVPYPEDPYSEQIEKLAEEVKDEICKYKAASDERIDGYERRICYILSQIPFEDMSMDEFVDAFPNDAPDFINRPTFWPHTPDEQIKSQPVSVPATLDVDQNATDRKDGIVQKKVAKKFRKMERKVRKKKIDKQNLVETKRNKAENENNNDK